MKLLLIFLLIFSPCGFAVIVDESITCYSSIDVSYSTAMTSTGHKNISVESSLDDDVVILLDGSNTPDFTVNAGKSFFMNNITIDGDIDIKARSATSTSGEIIIRIW